MDSVARMGRKPLGFEEFKVQLDPAVVAEVDKLVGNYRRSEFIRDAMATKLAAKDTPPVIQAP